MAKASEVYPDAKFGRLTVMRTYPKFSKRRNCNELMTQCQCECGKLVDVVAHALGKNTKSCGCLHIDKISSHGLTKNNERLYYIWHNMVSRCTKPEHKAFKNYGGRGVAVCAEWLSGFEAFHQWAIANGYDDTLTIDRIDPSGNYESSNCRWLPREKQNGNKRTARTYSAWGETKPVSDWLEDPRCTYKNRRIIRQRVFGLKWTPEEAMTTPAA